MPARMLTLDAAASRLVIRTRAVGMLARLAHDLELRAHDLEGKAELDGDAWTGELVVTVAGLDIEGVLKGDRLDPNVLSTADRAEIRKKMRADAFRGAARVAIRASGTSRASAALTIAVDGREAKTTAPLRVHEDGAAIAVAGSTPLSLKALGSKEIKAPLGAFAVKDQIEIAFDLRFI